MPKMVIMSKTVEVQIAVYAYYIKAKSLGHLLMPNMSTTDTNKTAQSDMNVCCSQRRYIKMLNAFYNIVKCLILLTLCILGRPIPLCMLGRLITRLLRGRPITLCILGIPITLCMLGRPITRCMLGRPIIRYFCLFLFFTSHQQYFS